MSRVLVLGGLLIILAGSAVAWAAGHQGPPSPPLARLEGTVVWPAATQRAAAFALRDQTGHLITRASLRGRIWAITFLDSRCTQACPVEAQDLARVQADLGPHYPLKIVIVSVLPGYDNPQRVEAFAHKAGLSGDWHWLLGSHQQLAPVWRAYGIWVLTGIEHTAALYLVDRHGSIRVADGVPFLPDQLAASVRALSGHTVPRRGSSA
jgi:protein SCO1/2